MSSNAVELWGPLGLILIIGLTIVVIAAVNQWRRVRIAEMDATLKQQMLDRGMTADEIVQVLGASNRAGGCQATPHETAAYRAT